MKNLEFQENQLDITNPSVRKGVPMANRFVSIKEAEKLTSLSRVSQYRFRKAGHFPRLINLSSNGSRRAYRFYDLEEWIKDPQNYRS